MKKRIKHHGIAVTRVDKDDDYLQAANTEESKEDDFVVLGDVDFSKMKRGSGGGERRSAMYGKGGSTAVKNDGQPEGQQSSDESSEKDE